MLKKSFGDNSLGQTQTYDWHKSFKNGGTSTFDGNRSGRPSIDITPENAATKGHGVCLFVCTYEF
jgi:hypothetical protein